MARKLTLDEIRSHLLFKSLTDKQRAFLLSYIETGDKSAAVKLAYGDIKNAENMAWRCMNTPSIRKLLTLYHGQEMPGASMTRSELITLISARLRDSETSGGDFVKLATMLTTFKFQGLKVSEGEEDVPDDLNALVKQLEGKG